MKSRRVIDGGSGLKALPVKACDHSPQNNQKPCAVRNLANFWLFPIKFQVYVLIYILQSDLILSVSFIHRECDRLS